MTLWYIASRTSKKKDVQDFIKQIKQHGHDVTHDWTVHDEVKPYHANPARSSSLAKQMITAVQQSDVFVLISDKGGTGMFVELGAALTSEKKDKRVYVVGEYNERTLFCFHPRVVRTQTLYDVLKHEGVQ